MELADVTDSKSVGSNTVRVRPPPSAPKSVTPLNEWGYTFCVLVGGRTRNLRVVQGCTMAVAQSRCTMQRPKRPQFDNPATLSPAQQAGYYFWCGGRENPQLAGRAGMLTSNNLYNFSSNVLTNYNNILQNPFKFVILYQKTKRPREPKDQ